MGSSTFFAERLKDDKRMAVILKRYDPSRPDPYDQLGNGVALFWSAHDKLQKLYETIDKGGPDAAKARAASVEFISQNSQK